MIDLNINCLALICLNLRFEMNLNHNITTRAYFKASSFKYPSRKERTNARLGFPKLMSFDFEDINEWESILTGNKDFEEVKKCSYLYQWDICLKNKIGKMRECYVYLTTNFNRGIPDIVESFRLDDHLNNFLFDFYAEAFYYFYFSTRDIIGQILNVYCDLGLEEERVKFSQLSCKILEPKIKDIVLSFISSTTDTSSYRNTFTHRFPPNYPDFRPKVSMIAGAETFSGGRGNYIKPKEFVKNIDESLILLELLLNNLRVEFHQCRNSNAAK